MGASNSKVEGICRPAQSGKTRTYQALIKDYEMLAELFFDCEGFVNVVVCSNNTSLVQQTASRHTAELYESSSVESDGGAADDRIEGKVFSWFSGTKENNLRWDGLANRIKEDEVSMVVACAHAKRIGFIVDLLKDLNRSKVFKKKVNVWIDEADESISKWSKVDIASLQVVHSVTLISATFDAIVKKYGKVRVRCYDVAHPATYVGFKDCDVTRKDIAVVSAPAYLAAVYNEFSAQLCVPGMRLFAPGDNTQESHDNIAEFLCARGWAVLVLNGARKEVVKPDGQVLPIADYVEWDNGTPEEIGRTITSIYYDSGLAQFPFAITGQICLGRGLTFQNERFLFDWAVVPNMVSRATAYQCAARVLGNIKDMPNYKQCKVVTTSRMQRLIEQAENIAINIGHGERGQHAVVDKEALKRAQGSDDMKMSVPVVITITADELEDIYKSKSDVKRQKILDKLDSVLRDTLRTYECKQVTRPKAGPQFQKAVTDVANAAANGRRPGLFTKEEKKTNVWQAILDDRDNRIIVTYYRGA